MNAGHPRDESLRIWIRPPALPGVHPGEMGIPLVVDEVKREGKLPPPDQAFILYSSRKYPDTGIPSDLLWHETLM
ncbi:hypothetical protein ASZ90_011113 [hydrocarbon metagenome]|uniref:Uncharacterized protein n=1 Tax=hydrocarbon metagenome TaxID=938273 RepID=A0A0W8FEW6_9ZZZZ